MSVRSTYVCVFLVLALFVSTSVGAAEPPHENDEIEDEIVVTASPIAKSSDELAIPINSLDRDHLVSHLGTTLGETLSREVGISTSGFAPGASRPVVRGQDSFRVRVLENGLGTADVSAISGDHGVPVNPLAAKRVEVLRGPATLRYGGGAIAGAVNVLTNVVPRETLDESIAGEVFGGWGSIANDSSLAARIESGQGPWAFHADGVLRESRDYGLPDSGRRQPNTGIDARGANIGGAYIGERGRIGLGAQWFSNDYGISEPESADPPSIDLDRKSVDLEADWKPSGFIEEARFRGRYTDYAHDERDSVDVLSRFRADTGEARLELLHAPIFSEGSGAIGFHGLARTFEARGEGAELLAPSETLSFAAYVFENFLLENGTDIEFGGRVERTTVRGRAPDGNRRRRTFVPLSVALNGLVGVGGGVSLGSSVSLSQRAPDALELFAMGPHEADETFQLGDADIDEETSFNAELLLRGDFERVSFEASAFYTYYDGFIFGQLTGNTRDEDGTVFMDDSGELDELFYLQEDAHFYGAEIAGEGVLASLYGGEVGLDAQIDFVRARLDGGPNVPRIPPLRWGGGVYFAGDRLRARVGFLRHEDQSRAGSFETETPGYTFVDTSASLRLFGDVQKGVELIVAIDNLTDARARSAVSFKKEDQRLPGRNVRIGLRGQF